MPTPDWAQKIVLLCPIANSFSWVLFESSYTTAIVSPHFPGSFTKLVRARETLFSTFLTRNKGTTDESHKRVGCYQREQLNLPREYSVSDGPQCIVNNRKFKMRWRRESQMSNSVTRQNNNFAHASRFFAHFFAARLPVKMPNFTFCEGRKQAMTKFSFSLWTWIWLIEIQLQKSSLAFDKVS